MHDILNSAGPFPQVGLVSDKHQGCTLCGPSCSSEPSRTQAPPAQGTNAHAEHVNIASPLFAPQPAIQAQPNGVVSLQTIIKDATDHAEACHRDVRRVQEEASQLGADAMRWNLMAGDLRTLYGMLPRSMSLDQSHALARICNHIQRIGV